MQKACKWKKWRKTKLLLDRGYVKSLNGSRLYYHLGDAVLHIDLADPEKNPIGHIQKDIIGRSRGSAIMLHPTERWRWIKGGWRKVVVWKKPEWSVEQHILK